MGTRAFAVLVAVVFGGVIGACKSELLPDRCDKDTDCKGGKTCNTRSETGGYGTCVLKPDGGDGGSDADGGELDAGDAGDAGDARDAFSCEVATCTIAEPICDMAMMKCRTCAASGECEALGDTTPVCAASGKCVECGVSKDCKDAKPICQTATNTCIACTKNEECGTRDNATLGCASGKCVECTESDHCPTTKPACKAGTHTCVECVTNDDCKPETPICDTATNTCKPCKADAECTMAPKVCMSHDKGRCAKDEETIYVQALPNCTSTVSATNGTATVPYCSLDPAVTALGTMTAKNLIVVRGIVNNGPPFAIAGRLISIVGQMNASIGSAPAAIRLTAGELYVRQVELSTGNSLGCQASNGSTLRLDHVAVTGNKLGGIFLDGAAFEIKDTTVTNNGPGVYNGFVDWGGIFVNNPPATGPTTLQRVTVQNNQEAGIRCSVQLTMTSGVLASGNKTHDIHPTCNFPNCGTASATCGAQP